MKSINLFLSLMAIFVELISAQQISQCFQKKPFRMIDNTCANFSEICIKSDYPPCETLLNACQQCPPSNFTVTMLTELLTIANDQLNKTKEVLEKKLNVSRDQLVSSHTNLENQLASKQIMLERNMAGHFNSTKHNFNKIKEEMRAFFVFIILIILVVLILLFVEIRFKLITKCCQNCAGKARRTNYKILQSRKKCKDNEFRQSVMDTHGTLKRQLDDFSEFPSEFTCIKQMLLALSDANIISNLSEIQTKLDSLLEARQSDISFATIKFRLKGRETSIDCFVRSDDNIVKVKKQICPKWPHTESQDFKIMKLIYRGEVLDDNQYLLLYTGESRITVECEINRNLSTSDIVVLQLRSSRPMPELVQMNKNQTIGELKSMICSMNGVKDVLIFKENQELRTETKISQNNLQDYDWIRVVVKENSQLTLNSIFDDREPIVIEYVNTEQVSTLKMAIARKKHFNPKDLILFVNNESLSDETFIFEIGIEHQFQIKYCRFMSLDDVIIDGDAICYGDFAEIFKAQKRFSERQIMLKRYQLTRSAKMNEDKALLNELKTFQIIKDHERFVQLLGICKTSEYLYIEIEMMVEGSIKEYLLKNLKLTEKEIALWSVQILEGLKFLHDQDIVHRDLKPSNILVDDKHNVKLSSFNLTKYSQGYLPKYLMDGFEKSKEQKYRYMAPEVCNNESFGKPADIWSFGATLVEIVTGTHPFPNKSEADALIAISESRTIEYKLPRGTSKKLEDFIYSCVKNDPRERDTVDKLLENVFLTKQ